MTRSGGCCTRYSARYRSIFFSEAVGEPPQAATGEAPTDEQEEPPVQPPAADHGADSARVRRRANVQGCAARRRRRPGTAACRACMCTQAGEAASTSGRSVRDRGRGGARFGSPHSSQRYGRAAAAKAQLRILPVGPATAAHDRVSAACTSWAAVCVGRRIKAATYCTAITCPQT